MTPAAIPNMVMAIWIHVGGVSSFPKHPHEATGSPLTRALATNTENAA